MNLSTLTTWAAQFAGDPQQTRYAGKYTAALNEAQVQFAMDTRCLFKDQTYSVVSGQSNYNLPSDFMFERKVTISTDNSPPMASGTLLIPISRAGLEFYVRDRTWGDDTGTPKFYIIDPAVSSGSPGSLVLYPQPQGVNAGTNNLIMTYFPYPTAMSAASDTPLNATTNLQQFHIALAEYAAWLLTAIDVQTPEITTKRDRLYAAYQNKVTECIDRYGNTPGEPLRIRGGRTWL